VNLRVVRMNGPGSMPALGATLEVSSGLCSVEVRWILPGHLEIAMARWFGRFPSEVESREDCYLLDPVARGLSVKFRGGGALEVKAYQGSRGALDVAGRARGRLEAWRKWSFPFNTLRQDGCDPANWRPVSKKRRVSRFASSSGQWPRCEVELTEVRTDGRDWWTLGFEATGPASLLCSELEAAAAVVFANALPGNVKLGPDNSRSYAQWLGERPTTGNGAVA
jgi:hypothetical protein